MKTTNQVSRDDQKIETPLTKNEAVQTRKSCLGLKPMKSMARVKSIKPNRILPVLGKRVKVINKA